MVVKNIIKSCLMIPLSCLSVLSRLEERKKKFMVSILSLKKFSSVAEEKTRKWA